MDLANRSMKAQFKIADRERAKFCLVLGDDELAKGEIMMKNLSTGEQSAIPRIGNNFAAKTGIVGGIPTERDMETPPNGFGQIPRLRPQAPPAHRLLRLAYRLVLLAAIVAVSGFLGTGVWRWAEFLLLAHRCLHFALPPSHVMYESADGKVIHSETVLAEIRFDHLGQRVILRRSILHEMRRPDGSRWLVALNLTYVPGGRATPRHAGDSRRAMERFRPSANFTAGKA